MYGVINGNKRLLIEKQKKLLTLHADAIDEAFVLFTECWSNILKDVCCRYATTHLHQLLTTTKNNGQDVRSLKTISYYTNINDNIIGYN